MYLYTVTGAVGEEGYLDLAKSGDLTGKNVYVNMTNKCPCSCVFCLRQTKQQQEGNTLWLKEGEPSVETMLELFAQYDLNVINELVFCGFGEPLEPTLHSERRRNTRILIALGSRVAVSSFGRTAALHGMSGEPSRSGSAAASTSTPAIKSSIRMASCGLCDPRWLATKSIAVGIPAFAK